MKRTLTFFILAVLVFSTWELLAIPSHAQEVIIINSGLEKYKLGLALDYLEDPTGELTIGELVSQNYETQFVSSEKDIPIFGLTDSAYWGRFRLKNETQELQSLRLIVSQPYLDFVDLYLPDDSGQFQVKQAGDKRPFKIREIEHSHAVFKVVIPPQSEQTLYLRIQSSGMMMFDLTLWAGDAFDTYTSERQLFLGFFLGALCIMAIYNFFLFLALNDRSYIHYVLFLVTLTFHLATLEYGYSYQYLWRDRIIFNAIAPPLFQSLAMFFALAFTIEFLKTKTYAPTIHKVLHGLRVPFLLFAIISVLQLTNLTIIGISTLTIPSVAVMMIAGIQTWRNGYKPARYYIIAGGMIWLNVIVFVLHSLRIITFVNHAQFVPLSVTCLVLLLSMALADRITTMKRETEQAIAESNDLNRQLKENQKRLSRSEKKYRTIFEESNDIIFITTLDGKVEDINPVCKALSGYTRSEALQLNVLDVYANPAERVRFQEIMLKNGFVRDFEVKLRRKDGSVVDAMVTATLRHADDGTVIGFQGIIRDMTMQKQAEAERMRALSLQSEKELAEAANKAKGLFLANMSHELRTPLTAILGFSEMMTRDQNLTLEQQRNLETIGRSGEYLLALINEVLELSKIEDGNVELRLEKFDLHQMLLSIEEMFLISAEKKSLILEIISEPEVPRHIRADQNKLRQVLINLLNNAVKYTEKGVITLRVRVCNKNEESEFQTQDDQVLTTLAFEVEDTGKGIAANDLNSIFQAFFQKSNESKSNPGAGLGLAISQKFVRAMGGELEVSSQVGKGTTFHFALQVREAHDSGTVEERLVQRVRCLEPGQKDFRILVVEDNEINRDLLIKLLGQVGFAARGATNGREAVDMFEQWRPHLIWMDIRMPVMDGYEATRRIKEKRNGEEPVIIALTASAFEEDRIKVLKSGCDDFVRKPFKENEIFEKMSKYLNVRFLYKTLKPAKIKVENAQHVELTPELLLKMPEDLRLKLKNAVDVVDFDETVFIIKKLHAQNASVAGALNDLVHQYQFDKLQKLLG